MVKGAFKSFVHKHYFQEQGNITIMHDRFLFESPFWLLGRFVNWIYLEKYMRNLLTIRNKTIKDLAEKQQKEFLQDQQA